MHAITSCYQSQMTPESLLFEVNSAVAGSNSIIAHQRLPQMHDPQDNGDPEQTKRVVVPDPFIFV